MDDVPPTPDVQALQEDLRFRIYDGLLALGLGLCLIVGLPGNCLAWRHFHNSRKKGLSTLLYQIACTFDSCSNVIHLPVIISMLNTRKPGPFGNYSFCTGWYFVLQILQQMSMFAVMLQSISRAIVIVFPFYKVNKKAVLISLVIYFLFHISWTTLYFMNSTGFYSPGGGYCARWIGYDQTPKTQAVKTMYFANYSLCVGVPPLAVFFAFVTSVIKLRESRTGRNTSHSNKHEASVTISYFAALFLLCNSITFMNIMLFTATSLYGSYPGKIYSNEFMFFYSWPISEIFCPVLNASLNPLLYLWRMKEMRLSIKEIFRFDNIHKAVEAGPCQLSQVQASSIHRRRSENSRRGPKEIIKSEN